MEPVKSRRELYAEATRQALIDTARRLFVERGYGEVSAEELVAAAGLSRGALYHHFDGKQGVFEAVFVELEIDAARRIGEAMAAAPDLWHQALAGIDAFLDVCTERDYREIVLLQAPLALGWDRWRTLDHEYLGGLTLAGVKALLDAGLLEPHPPEMLAAAIFGALTEASLLVATADDPKAARADAGALALTLLTAVARKPES
jgi:AcrR family transcriptional regulator